MFNGNCEKRWLILIDHQNCGCQLFSDKLIYVYINNPSQDIYIYIYWISTAYLAWEDSPTNSMDVSHYIPSVTNNIQLQTIYHQLYTNRSVQNLKWHPLKSFSVDIGFAVHGSVIPCKTSPSTRVTKVIPWGA